MFPFVSLPMPLLVPHSSCLPFQFYRKVMYVSKQKETPAVAHTHLEIVISAAALVRRTLHWKL